MRQCFKLLLLLVFVTIGGCQIDEDVIDKKNHSDVKITEKTFDELIHQNDFKTAFSKIPKKKATNSLSRTVMEDQYGFTISEQPVKIIQSGNRVSYTMLITRDNGIHDYFENLIVEVDSLNNTTAFIMKYNPDKGITEETAHNSFSFKGTQEITPIIYNAAQVTTSNSGKMITDCFVIKIYYCDHDYTHVAGPNCSVTYPVTSTLCYSYDDGTSMPPPSGGGGSGNGSGDGNGSGGSGGGSTAPVVDYHYYTPTRTNGGNYLGLTTSQMTWLNSQTIILRKMILAFDPELNPDFELSPSDLITFLMQNQQAPNIIGLNNYLSQNGITSPNLEFLSSAIKDLMQNPSLIIDFNLSSKSPAFIDFSAIDKNTPEGAKFNEVYNALITSPTFKNLFINLFGTQNRFNIKFQIGTPSVPSANGDANTNILNPTLNTITIKPSFIVSKSKLDIAKTIMHECIHAFLFVKLCEPNIGMSIPTINSLDLYSIINSQYNGFNGSQEQHNFMYDYMLPLMTQTLIEIKDLVITPAEAQTLEGLVLQPPSINHLIPFDWNQFYLNVCLTGLQSCNFFQNEIGTLAVVNGVGTVTNVVDPDRMYLFNVYNTYKDLYLHP